MAEGETWRAMRQILSPTFSTFKMKAVSYDQLVRLLKVMTVSVKMTPIIQRSVVSLVEVFQNIVKKDGTFEALK